jgi:hypothetical protein
LEVTVVGELDAFQSFVIQTHKSHAMAGELSIGIKSLTLFNKAYPLEVEFFNLLGLRRRNTPLEPDEGSIRVELTQYTAGAHFEERREFFSNLFFIFYFRGSYIERIHFNAHRKLSLLSIIDSSSLGRKLHIFKILFFNELRELFSLNDLKLKCPQYGNREEGSKGERE